MRKHTLSGAGLKHKHCPADGMLALLLTETLSGARFISLKHCAPTGTLKHMLKRPSTTFNDLRRPSTTFNDSIHCAAQNVVIRRVGWQNNVIRLSDDDRRESERFGVEHTEVRYSKRLSPQRAGGFFTIHIHIPYCSHSVSRYLAALVQSQVL